MDTEIFVEKFRPKKLSEIVGNKKVIEELKTMVKNGNINHSLFHGKPGTGKTTTALAIGNELYGELKPINFMELNASDERKIETVRDKIKYFAKSLPLEAKFKIILLDEVDSMYIDAQQALRRIMEKYAQTCRFILSCNSVSKVVPAIVSRCSTYNFQPIEKEEMIERLRYICKMEQLDYDEESIKYIVENSNGDMRWGLNKLQTTGASGKVSMENLLSNTLDGTFNFIVSKLVGSGQFDEVKKGMVQFLQEGGTEREFLLKFHNYIVRNSTFNKEQVGKTIHLVLDADRDLLLGVNNQFVIDVFLIDVIKLRKLYNKKSKILQ
tara:strand:- start:9820 stop:10791 length:972 start_codon:yes stop_codon:yes gene_type:complete